MYPQRADMYASTAPPNWNAGAAAAAGNPAAYPPATMQPYNPAAAAVVATGTAAAPGQVLPPGKLNISCCSLIPPKYPILFIILGKQY